MKRTIHESAARWLSEIKDAKPGDGSIAYQPGLFDNLSETPGSQDMYSKAKAEEIVRKLIDDAHELPE